MQTTKVYAVIGGADYEGEDFKSLRLFDCHSTAIMYKRDLEDCQGFDYSIMEERVIMMESAVTWESYAA
jgi:hypothetical protein